MEWDENELNLKNLEEEEEEEVGLGMHKEAEAEAEVREDIATLKSKKRGMKKWRRGRELKMMEMNKRSYAHSTWNNRYIFKHFVVYPKKQNLNKINKYLYLTHES